MFKTLPRFTGITISHVTKHAHTHTHMTINTFKNPNCHFSYIYFITLNMEIGLMKLR